MWIRSQDKQILMEIKALQITVSEGGVNILNAYDKFFKLGTYSTYEKAIKVLDMIHYNIERLKFAEMNPYANLSYEVIFEMPKDEEVE